LVKCPDGQYNDGQNSCVKCGTNCTSCANLTGACITCASGNSLSPSNSKDCTSACPYPVGPVAAPTGCLAQMFSPGRLIPPFASNSTSVDWRTWGIVSPMLDQD